MLVTIRNLAVVVSNRSGYSVRDFDQLLGALYRLRLVRPNSELNQTLDMSEVHLKKGEPVDKALRRLKKKLDREQTLVQVRLHRRFEKPSAKRRRKEKAARFSAMLKARYADV